MLTEQQITRILANALPDHRLTSFKPLTGGMRNLNYLLHLAGTEDRLVLRICTRDSAICRRELDFYRLVSGWIPVREVVYADPSGEEDIGPYMLKRYVDGVTFQELKENGNGKDIAQAAYTIGATLARFQTIPFSQSGPVHEDRTPKSKRIDMAETLKSCLMAKPLEQRLGIERTNRLRDFLFGWSSEVASLDLGTGGRIP